MGVWGAYMVVIRKRVEKKEEVEMLRRNSRETEKSESKGVKKPRGETL